MIELLLLTLIAGLAIPLGAAIATAEHLRPHWLEAEFRHSVIAFGGGILLSAVALVLVPEGAKALPTVLAVGIFLGGGLGF